MAGNTFGRLFRVTTFGESHGPAVGCVVDGCPAGVRLVDDDLRRDLARRRPGGGGAATGRVEGDEPEILSGVFEGRTLGTPIAVVVRNTGQRPGDYDALRDVYRPGHADWTWEAKYGVRDHRGGGRSSARETVGRVAAGAVARAFLRTTGVSIRAWTRSACGVTAPEPGEPGFDWDEIESNPLRMPERGAAERAGERLAALRAEGDSAGCVVACLARGLPPGLGEPVFDKLDALIGAAMLSIGAVKGVEFGAGFAAAAGRGSALNDRPVPAGADGAAAGERRPNGPPPVAWPDNHAGGVLGGISTGADLRFAVAFKPVPSIGRAQTTVNRRGEVEAIRVGGRHDGCVGPRAVPVVEAMTALVLADLLLIHRAGAWGLV